MTSRVLRIFVVFLVFVQHGAGDKYCTQQCAPQNTLLTNISQEVQLTWDLHHSCLTQKNLVFELIVLIQGKQVHSEEVEVAEHVGSSHLWRWTSFLPLECAPHSVKIRPRCINRPGVWRLETLPGLEHTCATAEVQVFPQDYVFKVGSRATFFCIIPTADSDSEMSLSNYNDAPYNTSMLNHHLYALTVDLLWPTLASDADIKCKTSLTETGACAIVGYQPSDRNLTCETRDFLSAECFWKVGPQIFSNPTNYRLLEQSCSGQIKGKCSLKVEIAPRERNWTLIAENVLGTIELIDEADLTKRVYMHAPERLTISSVNARNATLNWVWTIRRYNLLNLTCQIYVTNGADKIQIEKNGFGLTLVVINGLFPNCTYIVMVRCGAVSDFWKWGDWSQTMLFNTKGDIPDALDVWMHKEGNHTRIMWKLLENHQSNGNIIDYEVTWADSEEKERKKKLCIVHPNQSAVLNLSPNKKYNIFVTARNACGRSSPSQMIISHLSQEALEWDSWRIHGIAGGFSLSWTNTFNATCGYIVDWCPMSGDSIGDWIKVPPNTTNATIYSKSFKDGVRYRLSLYLCSAEALVRLAVREGYTKEQKIPKGLFKNLRWEQYASDVKISWDSISLREQSAFIKGYVLYCKNESAVIQEQTDNPRVSSLTARNLNTDSYTFSVYALTSVGECGLTSLYATLNSQSDALVSAFLISLIVFSLLCVLTVVCYRQRARIKQKVYPPIPQPVLTGKWLPSPKVVSYCPSEEHMSDPVIYCKIAPSEDGYICPKEKSINSTTTVEQNHLKKHIPCERISPPTSSLVSSGVNGFPNPVYDLLMQGNNAQEHPDTTLWDTEGVSISKTYNLQDFIENDSNADHMSCVSAYIVLPHST